MMPTVSLNVEDVKISKDGSIGLKELEGKMYEITGKVIDGYFHFGYCDTNSIYLIIDAGFLLRVSINIPNKHLKIKRNMDIGVYPSPSQIRIIPKQLKFQRVI